METEKVTAEVFGLRRSHAENYIVESVYINKKLSHMGER